LTESNPTRAGIEYPLAELGELLRKSASAPYDPDPLGMRSSREALAEHLATPGDPVHPNDLVLTSSTSEAYSYLFKILADPGDEIVTHTPSYPLLDHLAELEAVRLRRFPLHFHGARWELETSSAAAAMEQRARAVVVIHPNNPTGSYLSLEEQNGLAALCAEKQVPIISDEVFLDYPIGAGKGTTFAAVEGVPVFALGGLSKGAGLPHWKLGWIRLGGAQSEREAYRKALELVADSFLSVHTAVQAALPDLLPLAERISDSIRARIRGNASLMSAMIGRRPAALQLLPIEGGWSAVIRVPSLGSDEDLAIELIEAASIVVQPGYFFDFASEGYLVVSLLCEPEQFETGTRQMLDFLSNRCE
ncbi:MAG: pyridoxal phosphate-dependent aminotransferase, partial [Acidobacteria bacterium]|nr:pyridoxal phosphate-dependent aminotransferase [Acidobacteriota bacterium]